jgi:pyruvate dehydrogenase E1 component
MLRSDSLHAPRASPNTPRAAEHLYTSVVDTPDPAARELDGDVELETAEWLQALADVLRVEGPERAGELLKALLQQVRHDGVSVPGDLTTPYLNTIETAEEPPIPGERKIEHSLRSLVRWNAMALVLQANRESSELGGHIASYQSAATLYEVGFNHFWHAPHEAHGGDLVYIQGHSAPGIYARAFLEGRLDEQRVRGFRQEVGGHGLSSYPHPWLMPDFWQFPTVSMGLGPLMAIYQARFMKYLEGREIQETAGRKVWAFMGDGEMDEPESMGAISLAGREHLDNLIFVVNCNLQRLDGPVRGNGKIIQELETNFRGAGWNVIKVIWGSRWDPLLAADEHRLLRRRMEEALDGDYQTYKSRDGAFVREHFFGTSPELRALVQDLSDEQVWALNRGGHDPRKVFAAYAAASAHVGQPTVILAKTIKGYGMGVSGEGQNITHQQKKMTEEALLAFRDRFELPLTDEQARAADLYMPAADSPELSYLRERRAALGGALPSRRRRAESLEAPPLSAFQSQLDGTGEREISTTMAFVRVLATLVRDKQLGQRIVPIVPDESRTFGMEGMFRQLGIFSQVGQLYQPEDAEQLMFYKEDRRGQILQEGINEPGAFSSWLAAATSYTNHGTPMIPFYIFYSMFGFQRVGDLAWAAGDSRARGFLIGGTSGRTTLNGEGLQHEDGQSHLLASTIPNCRAYDPAFGYELAVIVHDGLRRLLEDQEDAFYYLTVMNENYPQPAIPDGAEDGILRGMHRIQASADAPAARLLGSGAILREVIAGAELLREDFGVETEVWSVTSFSQLQRDGIEVDRENRLHPSRAPRRSYVQECLGGEPVPVIASTDYVRAVAEQIRPWIDGPDASYTTLGTDGFGRSDYRRVLRSFFEVDRHHVALATLHALGRTQDAESAIERYAIDQEGAPPWTR